ncbi:hypothetical protein [Aureivirga sp. CE67]|uniref:hypothetical protein n=1 Tax=Aureivirga sp. CE67 TaxID=1788983 RepID=UPI0018C90AE9|nr:hypothetical protein [Aureivirga sp. CE67]
MISTQLFIGIYLLISVLIVLMFFIKSKKALSIFPDLDSVTILFREKYASGRSNNSFLTKIGGSKKTLEVILTTQEFWVRGNIITAAVSLKFDLIHKIPFSKIKKVERTNGSMISIYFVSEANVNTNLELKLKNPDQFIDILKREAHV